MIIVDGKMLCPWKMRHIDDGKDHECTKACPVNDCYGAADLLHAIFPEQYPKPPTPKKH